MARVRTVSYRTEMILAPAGVRWIVYRKITNEDKSTHGERAILTHEEKLTKPGTEKVIRYLDKEAAERAIATQVRLDRAAAKRFEMRVIEYGEGKTIVEVST